MGTFSSRQARSFRSTRNRSHSKRSYFRKVRLELLETRSMLTTNWLVNTASDEVGHTGLSLRDAIVGAAASSGSDLITFSGDLTAQTIQLGSPLVLGGTVPLNGNIAIQGLGANQLKLAAAATSVFSLGYNPTGASVSIQGLKLTGGGTAINRTAPNLDLVLNQIEITGNTGSAIVFSGGGQITVSNSTIADNQTGTGPALLIGAGSSGTLTNVTISGNHSTGSVAGLRVEYTAVTLQNTTVVGNRADVNSSGAGGIYLVSFGSVALQNSIVAGNTANSSASDAKRGDSYGGLSGSYNLIGYDGSSLFSTSNGNQVGTNSASPLDPKLAPLAYYGGSTRTRAFFAGSPALDAGSDTLAAGLSTDQRGFSRIVGTHVDIGAFEASKQTLQVDNSVDENDGDYGPGDLSLREAVGLAAASIYSDTITFAPSISQVTVDSPLILGGSVQATGNITIHGPAADQLLVTGHGLASNVFSLQYNSAITLQIDGLTLSGATGAAIDRIAPGINLALDALEISDNGGAVSFAGGGDQLTIKNSAIINNHMASEPAIYLYAPSVSSLKNVTISGNESVGPVAGLTIIYGSVVLTNVTMTDNRADSGNYLTSSSGTGGVFADAYGTVTLQNTIVAMNTAGAPGFEVAADVGRVMSSGPYTPFGTLTGSNNLIGYDPDLSNGINNGQNGNQVGTNSASPLDPHLMPLDYYGGPTRTRAISPGSSVIDAGSNTFAAGLAYDQRGVGFNRLVDGDSNSTAIVDIGAYEYLPMIGGPSFVVEDAGLYGHGIGGGYFADNFDEVVRDNNGRSVVVWEATPESIRDVRFSAVSANGTVGTPVSVDGTLGDTVGTPEVQEGFRAAMNANGQFVIAFLVDNANPGYGTNETFGIAARIYHLDGSDVPVFDEQLFIPWPNRQGPESVAINTAGDIVITWLDGVTNDSPHTNIFAKVFKVGVGGTHSESPTFQVNSMVGENYSSTAALQPDGSFSVFWDENSAHTSFLRRYDNSASPVPTSSQIDLFANQSVKYPFAAVGMAANGEFALTWNNSIGEILVQQFGANGLQRASALNTHRVGGLEPAGALSMDATGDFVITWLESDSTVFASAFRETGDSVGGPFKVFDPIMDGLIFASVAMGPAGDFVVIANGGIDFGQQPYGQLIGGQVFVSPF